MQRLTQVWVEQVVANRVTPSLTSAPLPQTFMTLSLSDVSSRVSLSSAQEAELYIRNMVSSTSGHVTCV